MSRWSFLPFFLFAVSAILFGNAPQILFQSGGDSLTPFSCQRYAGGDPSILMADGNPAPCIDFTSSSVYTLGASLYTLPGLSIGQTLHGTLDFKILKSTSYPVLSAFGNAYAAQCNYDDSRRPVPLVEGRPWAGMVDITFNNQAGIIQTINVVHSLSLEVWHQSELFLTPRTGGGYDFLVVIDGVAVYQDVSSETIGVNELLGVLIGLSSSLDSHIRYDNIQIELYDDCTFFPSGQPLTFVRESGKPVLQSVSWESCGGPGELRIVNEGVSSAQVLLNGQLVAGPADFNPRVHELAFPVELPSGTNLLEVELRSKPGSHLTIEFVSTE